MINFVKPMVLPIRQNKKVIFVTLCHYIDFLLTLIGQVITPDCDFNTEFLCCSSASCSCNL